jgi:hypothetical protein
VLCSRIRDLNYGPAFGVLSDISSLSPAGASALCRENRGL